MLVREVDHRARNALAIVQSIVRMTKSKSIETYVTTVEGRIAALSTAHALLAESRWEGASLNRLVDEELAPYRNADAERIIACGAGGVPEAGDRADHCAGAARARHQRGQIRRAVGSGGQGRA